MLGAIRLIETRVAYYQLRVGAGATEPPALPASAADTNTTSVEQARYRALVDELLAPLAPAYVDSNLRFLAASFEDIPPPVQRGPEGTRVDFRLRLPDVAPADTGRVLAATTIDTITVQRFLWQWGQLSPLDRMPPREVEHARLWAERFLAQGPMDADAIARGYDRLPEVEAAVQRQRDAFAGEWYFRRRLPCYWYATDLNRPPIGERKMRWPGREPYEGTFHELFPSWKAFWAERPDKERLPEVAAPAPAERFLATLRRGAPEPKIRVR